MHKIARVACFLASALFLTSGCDDVVDQSTSSGRKEYKISYSLLLGTPRGHTKALQAEAGTFDEYCVASLSHVQFDELRQIIFRGRPTGAFAGAELEKYTEVMARSSDGQSIALGGQYDGRDVDGRIYNLGYDLYVVGLRKAYSIVRGPECAMVVPPHNG